MRRTILAAMMSLMVLICCPSSSWAGFWPFGGNGERKTHEALDVMIQTGSETAKNVRETKDDIRVTKAEMKKNLQKGFGGLRKEMKELVKATQHKEQNIKPILVGIGSLLIVILLLIIIAIVIFFRKKSPEVNVVKSTSTPVKLAGPDTICSICEKPVYEKNLGKHLRRSKMCKAAKNMGKKVELIKA